MVSPSVDVCVCGFTREEERGKEERERERAEYKDVLESKHKPECSKAKTKTFSAASKARAMFFSLFSADRELKSMRSGR